MVDAANLSEYHMEKERIRAQSEKAGGVSDVTERS